MVSLYKTQSYFSRESQIYNLVLPTKKKRIKEDTIFTSSARLAEFAIFTRFTTLTISSLVSYCTSTIFIFFRCNSISSAYRRANNLAEPNITELGQSADPEKSVDMTDILVLFKLFLPFLIDIFRFLEFASLQDLQVHYYTIHDEYVKNPKILR